MAQRRKSTNWRGIIIFLVLVGLTGYALASSGNLDNPFRIFTQAQGRGEGTFPERPEGEASERGEMPEGAEFQGRGGEESASINWSSIGSVLFNLWYLAATTAVIIIIQRPLGFLITRIRQRFHPPASAAPVPSV